MVTKTLFSRACDVQNAVRDEEILCVEGRRRFPSGAYPDCVSLRIICSIVIVSMMFMYLSHRGYVSV